MAIPTTGKTYRINNVGASGRRLNLYSSGSAANGTNVVLYTADNTNEQQWLYSNNRLYIKTNTSYCLDRYNSSSSANHNNADVWQALSSEDANQKITFVDSGSYFKIKLANAALYLTARSNANGTGTGKTTTSAGNVYWAASSTSTLQRWTCTEVSSTSSTGKGNGTLTEGVRPSTLNYNGGSYTQFSAGQCTWHAAGRSKEAKGKTIKFSQDYDLHAKNWYKYVSNCTKSQTAKANTIAVWDDGGSYGHVGYVESVSGDNVYFTEANWPTVNNKVDAEDGKVKKLTKEGMKARGSYKLLGYLTIT